jgi:uracil-DNA glycosylase
MRQHRVSIKPQSVEPDLIALIGEVRNCQICAAHLPHGVRPVVQASPSARIVIAGQAPGRRVHETGVPFDDPSGDRLRAWMGVSRDIFYDPERIAILPMGFCFPGTGKSGDLPPRGECAPKWRKLLLDRLRCVELTLVIGQYAQAWHLPRRGRTLTDTVKSWQDYAPDVIPLPHPSPRNNIWLSRNPWFEETLQPYVAERVRAVLER